ncbi:MAG TPA: hypothetical protein VFV08_14270, partial [Puia sp.]|nr:hypothetical protein [Puia sp.]
MKPIRFVPLMMICCLSFACQSSSKENKDEGVKDSVTKKENSHLPGHDSVSYTGAKASVILNRKEVPILCYHQIRDWRPTDSKTSRSYIVPIAA